MKVNRIAPLLFPLLGIFVSLAYGSDGSVPASEKMEAADVQFLLAGVEGIPAIGSPGPICVFGDNAEPLLLGKLRDHFAALAAALKYKKGRVVAFGHDGYIDLELLGNTADGERLLKNCIKWLGNKKDPCRIAVIGNDKVVDYLKVNGYDAVSIPNMADSASAKPFQIVVVNAGWIREEDIPELTAFIENGGGLLAGSLGWGWLQVADKTDLKTEHPGNKLLAPMGIVWAEETVQTTIERNGEELYGTKITSPLVKLSNALAAVRASKKDSSKATPSDQAQAQAIVDQALRAIPDEYSSKFDPEK